MEIIRHSKQKARKQHKCDWCLGSILPGQEYFYTAIKHGYFYGWRSHISCEQIAVKLDMFKDSMEEGIDNDDFREFIKNEYERLTDDKNDISFEQQLQFVKLNYKII